MKRRLVALVLIIALFVTTSVGAFADTVKLPASITRIEEETFYGDDALDVVDLPWGVESIESKAFAYSGISSIFIPNSVEYIAEDAFAGTDLTIYSSLGSVAKEFADANGIAWENSRNHYGYARDEVFVLWDEDNTDADEQETVEYITQIEIEDETDEDVVEILNEFNVYIQEMNDNIDSLDNDLSDFYEVIQDEDTLAEHSVEENEEYIIYEYDSYKIIIDKEITEGFDATIDFTDGQLSEDGSYIIIEDSNGNIYYMTSVNNSTYITKSIEGLPVYRSRATTDNSDSFLNSFRDNIRKVENFYSAVDRKIHDSLVSLTDKIANNNADILETKNRITEIEAEIDYLDKERDRLKGIISESESERVEVNNKLKKVDQKISAQKAGLEKVKKGLNEYTKILTKNTKQLELIKSFKSALGAFNIVGLIATAWGLYENWKELSEIVRHGHPNDEDFTPDSIELATTMHADIDFLLMYYRTDALMLIANVGLTLAALAVPGFVVAWPIILASLAGSLLLDKAEGIRKNSIDKAHARLHTFVYGTVYDLDTEEAIEGAIVTDGNNVVLTDDEGMYKFHIADFTNQIAVQKEDYNDFVFLVETIEVGTSLEKDIYLDKDEISIAYGYVFDVISGAPLVGQSVYLSGDSENYNTLTDETGRFELELPPGKHTLVFNASGFVTDYAKVNCIAGDQVVKIIEMNPVYTGNYSAYETDKGIVKGYVKDAVTGAPLAGVGLRCGAIGTFTASDGSFELYLLPRRGCVRVWLDGYEDRRVIMNPSGGYVEQSYGTINLTPEED